VILLITASSRAQECAEAIERKTHQKTLIARSPAKAAQSLQQQAFDALVFDESLQQIEPSAENTVLMHGESALPIYINLALHSSDRVATEVSCGLRRLVRERLASMRSAASELRNELRGEVTAILLNTALALRDKSLSCAATEKLGVVHELAEKMRRKLEDRPAEPTAVALKPRPVNKQPEVPVTH
jgi:hypothetical protein